ncbi:MAG: DUF2237 domain-containing protein [Candidatus Sericytochromatia bacterium]|nr:DUF2237 domain-containing protein [Candidatus Sericytochromatia bacterium]
MPSENPPRATSTQLNVLGEPLQSCSVDPLTGFTRTGCCEVTGDDVGFHAVCAVMTREFLAFSQARGNDLSTPMPQYAFPGLKPGDRWCLCAPRWQEALESDAAPKVVLASTHLAALEFCRLDDLKRHAVDV